MTRHKLTFTVLRAFGNSCFSHRQKTLQGNREIFIRLGLLSAPGSLADPEHKVVSESTLDDQWRCRGSLPGVTNTQSCKISLEAVQVPAVAAETVRVAFHTFL